MQQNSDFLSCLNAILLYYNYTGDLTRTKDMAEALCIFEVARRASDLDPVSAKRLSKPMPHEIELGVHYDFVNQLFTITKEITREELLTAIQSFYDIGKTKAEIKGGYIWYLLEMRFLEQPRKGIFSPGATLAAPKAEVEKNKEINEVGAKLLLFKKKYYVSKKAEKAEISGEKHN